MMLAGASCKCIYLQYQLQYTHALLYDVHDAINSAGITHRYLAQTVSFALNLPSSSTC